MDIFRKKILILYRYQIILLILSICLCICLYYFFIAKFDSRLGILAGGIGASLIVAIIQYIFDLDKYRAITTIKMLGIKKILPDRENEDFYRKLIDQSKHTISVMGVTAQRLMYDFADASSSRDENKVLISALVRKVTVKILLPDRNNLQDSDKLKYDQAKSYFEKLEYYSNFRVKYFNHIPTQSIFIIDDECILGPVFSIIPSKNTPCIYMEVNNAFAKKYLEYFDDEWDKAKIED